MVLFAKKVFRPLFVCLDTLFIEKINIIFCFFSKGLEKIEKMLYITVLSFMLILREVGYGCF
jgi:hypothetical protein